jgi:hypothetical protein
LHYKECFVIAKNRDLIEEASFGACSAHTYYFNQPHNLHELQLQRVKVHSVLLFLGTKENVEESQSE